MCDIFEFLFSVRSSSSSIIVRTCPAAKTPNQTNNGPAIGLGYGTRPRSWYSRSNRTNFGRRARDENALSFIRRTAGVSFLGHSRVKFAKSRSSAVALVAVYAKRTYYLPRSFGREIKESRNRRVRERYESRTTD